MILSSGCGGDDCHKEGAARCVDNIFSICYDGIWDTRIKCPENDTSCKAVEKGCLVIENVDSSSCTTDDWKCDNNALMKCNDGTWDVEDSCSENEQCNANTHKCDEKIIDNAYQWGVEVR